MEVDYPSSRFALRGIQLGRNGEEGRGRHETTPETPDYLQRVRHLEQVAETQRLDSALILGWRARVTDAVGNAVVVVGQHHVRLETLNDYVRQKSAASAPESTPSSVSHLAVKPPVVFPPVNHHVRRRKPLPTAADTLPPGCLSQLVALSWSYPHQRVEHDFAAHGLCRIPVTVTVVNGAETEVGFVLETGGVGGLGVGGGARGGAEMPASGVASASPVAPFSWSGPMVMQRLLAPGAQVRLPLIACMDRAGLFHLSALALRAAPRWMLEEEGWKEEESFVDSTKLTLQKCNPVRTVIVVDKEGRTSDH